MSKLGQRLRQLRGSQSLNAVGRGAGIVPIDISRFEQGKRVPTETTLRRLADYFEVPYDELRRLYFEDLHPPKSEDRRILLDWLKEIDR